MNSTTIARTGLIAAVYAALTLVVLTFLGGLAWGPIQFRISECVCVLALFFPEAVPGLTLGCIIANVINIPLSGAGLLGLFDVILGSFATFLAAAWMRKFRNNLPVALAGPVLFNALIIPAYLPIVCAGFGFYTIPFTTIDLEGSWLLMYFFGLIATGIGEAVVMYVLGLPLAKALKASKLGKEKGQAVSKKAAQGSRNR